MLYRNTKKEALAIYEEKINIYNATHETVTKKCEELYSVREEAVELIMAAEELINTIANSPKEITTKVGEINTEYIKFKSTKKYAEEAFDAAVKSGAGMASGVAGGAAIASLAPKALIWVATTFGKASTGTAISTLYGAAKTKATLAWIGRVILRVSGGSAAAGKALLALAGPVGWGLAGATVGGTVVFTAHKNKKVAGQVIEDVEKIESATGMLMQTEAEIDNIIETTRMLISRLTESYVVCEKLSGKSYLTMSLENKKRLFAFVNNAHSLAALLNKTVE